MNKIIVLAIVVLGLSSICYGQSWPDVTPVSGEVIFADPTKATFKVDITNIHLKPVYTLACQSGDLDDKDFNFSGLFHCRLVSLYSRENVSSLLIENLPQTADWEGRSRFLLNQVVGQCAAISDWGAERTFLLRRMRIMLGVHNVELGGNVQHPEVKSLKFTYSIIPDDNALSSIALKAQISEPWWFASGDNCIKEVLEKK
jgi:hypothetical protein